MMTQELRPGKDQPGPAPLRKWRSPSGGPQPGKEEKKSGTPLSQGSLGEELSLLPPARKRSPKISNTTRGHLHHHLARPSPPLPPHQSLLPPLAQSNFVQGA